jgi:predicted nucleic acid-binding protein
LTRSSKSEKAKELLDYLVDRGYELVTSINVVEEVLFILTRELLRNKRISGKENILLFISAKGYSEVENELSKFISLIEELEVTVLDPQISSKDLFKTMKEFHLLPNDALIAAIYRSHRIKRIATFDEDFKKVSSLEIFNSEWLEDHRLLAKKNSAEKENQV